MAKTGGNIPRRRGRPKIDRQAEIDDVLATWVERCRPDEPGLRHAVHIVVPSGPPNERGEYPHRHRREALYDALRNLMLGERIERAVRLAGERGIPVPRWAEAELALVRARQREWEAAAADPEFSSIVRRIAQLQAGLTKIGSFASPLSVDQSKYEWDRLLGQFCDLLIEHEAITGVTGDERVSIYARALRAAIRQIRRETGKPELTD